MSRPARRTTRRSALRSIEVRAQRRPENHDLPIPVKATPGSSGVDLRACIERAVRLPPGGRRLIPTGFAFAIPTGYEGQVRPRSGLAMSQGLTMLNTPGTIDSDYRGEVAVVAVNLGQAPVTIKRGDRIAQLVIAPVADVRMRPVKSLPVTRRGAGGFGHTGTR
jgi:dUTP pyrophosphatase